MHVHGVVRWPAGPQSRIFLKPPCSSYSRGTLARGILIGRTRIHATHLLAYKRGIWWCEVCGRYICTGATIKSPSMQKLKHPCKPPNKWGRHQLRRFRRGLTPRVQCSWPLAEEQEQALGSFSAAPRVRLNSKTSLNKLALSQAAAMASSQAQQAG